MAGILTNPYSGSGADPKTVHVTFLAWKPDGAHRHELDRLAADSGPGGAFGEDRFTVTDSDVFLLCPAGYGQTKLNNAYLERRSGRVATTRNWRTVTALAEMVGLGTAGD